MPPNPLRRRGKLASAGTMARGPGRKVLLLGGAAVVAAVVLIKRDRARALLPSVTSSPEPYSPPGPPQQSNYDVPGPVANTSTPIPAPDPVVVPDPVDDELTADVGAADQDAEPSGQPDADDLPVDVPPAIDEDAEEDAAAAEAAAIGGRQSDYAGTESDLPASEAERPLAEAGEGEAEGQEQADADLVANLAPRDAGLTDSERQIEDAIEQAGRPAEGETPEPLVSGDDASEEEDDDDDDGSSDWKTWSGGAVKP